MATPVLLAFDDVGLGQGPVMDIGEDAQDLLLVEHGVVVGEQVRPGDVVMDGADDGASEPRGHYVLLHPHEDQRLGPGLVALQYVQVHLVAIEVSVVWRTDAQIEAEGLAGHHPDGVGHHGHAVQGRLPVEQDHVLVHEVPLHHIARLQPLGYELGVAVGDLHPAPVGADDIVHSRHVLAVAQLRLVAVQDHLPEVLDISIGDVHRHGELPGRLIGNADLVDRQRRVGRDDGTGGEVDPLAGQVGAEAPLLALEPLHQGLERPARAVPGRRDARGLVVEVGGHVVLQKLPQVLHDQLRSARVAVLPQTLIDPQHVDQLMGQVILGAVAGLQGDGRAHRHRRYSQRSQYHPLRAARLRIYAQRRKVLVGYALQALPYLLGRELVAVLAEGGRLVQGDLLLGLAAVGAELLLGRPLGGLLGHQAVVDVVPAQVVHGVHGLGRLGRFLARHKQSAAGAAGGLQQLLDLLHQADMDDRHGQVDVPEVARTFVHLVAAGLAAQTWFDDAEMGVHEPQVDGEPIVVVGVGGDDLGGRHAPDLVRREGGEPYRPYPF